MEVGEKFGRLTVLSVAMEKVGARRRRIAHCQCDCGNVHDAQTYLLHSGKTKSCGCLYREHAAHMNRSHGLSGTPEYIAWKAMLQRCFYKNSKSYKNYGKRGITVCPEWRESFTAFFEHIGPKPSPEFTVERINNDRSYEPGNVRWATRMEQGSNTRKNRFIEIGGETKTLSQWARDFRMPIVTLWHRINRGGVPSLRR